MRRLGCIPSKALISVAKLYEKAEEGASFGIDADGIRVDLAALQKWKAGVVSTLETGVAALCRGNKVEVIEGSAEVVDAKRVKVMTELGTEEVVTKNLVIATGSRADIAAQGWSSTGSSSSARRRRSRSRRCPKSMLVVGGGYIGLEICGSVPEARQQGHGSGAHRPAPPGTEPDLVRLPQRNLEKRGAKILLKSKVLSLEKSDSGVKARVSTPSGEVVVEAERRARERREDAADRGDEPGRRSG